MNKQKQILILEDDQQIVDNLISTNQRVCFDQVKTLLELHGSIFDEPGIKFYDLVIMDLQLAMNDYSSTFLQNVFPDMFKEKTTRITPHCILYGWDYFTRIILKNEMLAPFINEKFILISGHTQWLIDHTQMPNGFQINYLIDKGKIKTHQVLYDRLRV